MIIKKKFRRYDLDSVNNVYSFKLTDKDKDWLKPCMELLQQPKVSTLIKQLAEIGSKVVLDKKTNSYIDILMNNLRRNQRIGLAEDEIKFKEKGAKVVDLNK